MDTYWPLFPSFNIRQVNLQPVQSVQTYPDQVSGFHPTFPLPLLADLEEAMQQISTKIPIDLPAALGRL